MAHITPTQALERAGDWLRQHDGVSTSDGDGFLVEGTPPLTIELSTSDDRLLITHTRVEPGAGAGRAEAVMAAIPDRGTRLQVAASVAKSGLTLAFTNSVYVDGLTRQSFATALDELVATVDRLGGTPAAETRIHQAITTPPGETADNATDTSEVEPVSVGWTPTHRVPGGGMRAWDEPDPSLQPSSRLEARVELQVAQRRGDWARAVGSNGWTGWVDARKLEEMAPAVNGSSTIDIGGYQLRPLPLLAAAVMAVAAFLPWVSVPGATTSINSFDVALSFLWDPVASGSPFLGWAVVALAALALVVAAQAKPNPALTRLLGTVAIATVVAFAVSIYRGVTDGGGTFGDAFDLIGIAPGVMAGAGAVMLAAARK